MKRITSILLIPFVFLAACGGSSGFDGDGAPAPDTGSFAIDTGNAMSVTGVAYKAALASGELAGMVDETGMTADTGGGLAKPVLQRKAGGLLDQITQNVPIGPDEQPCAVTGTATFSADVVDPFLLVAGAFSVGDTFRVVYANCDDGLDEIIDGQVDLVVEAFAGDLLSGFFELTMDMVATNLQVTTPDDVLSSHGDAMASVSTIDSPFVSASVSGNSMALTSNASSETLSAYNSAQTLDGGLIPAPYTMIAGGTLDSSQLPGVVTYSTPIMFEGLDANYPHTGEFVVESSSSRARLIAVDDVNVLIEIDTNKDNTVDETIETTWAELAGS